MNTLIAFDKFKDALTAREVCEVAKQAIQTSHPDWKIETAPLADGGDGFCDTLTGAIDGEFFRTTATAPLGGNVETIFGIVSIDSIREEAKELLQFSGETKRVAIIEMAQSSGIALLSHKERTPWKTTTFGLGELMKAGAEKGAEATVIGLGGSATHDLGLGALQALGFNFLDKNGSPLSAFPSPEAWPSIESIRVPSESRLQNLQIRIACDVENPLLGKNGAAAIFGPQKGLKPEDYDRLESLTERTARLLCETMNADSATAMSSPGAGAAGGTALGLNVALGGVIVPGFELVKKWIGLEEKLNAVDQVLTGEGRFDRSSFQGKGPGSLVRDALALGKKVHVFAGSVDSSIEQDSDTFFINAISPENMPLTEALRNTKSLLAESVSKTFNV